LNEVESKRILSKLQRKYPKKDGWTIQPRESKDKKKPDYLVERRNEANTLERIVVDARPLKRITDKDVTRLNTFARNMAGGRSRILGKVFAVPNGANTEIVPEKISVLFYELDTPVVEMPPIEAVAVQTV
jgi:hypothetical protein